MVKNVRLQWFTTNYPAYNGSDSYRLESRDHIYNTSFSYYTFVWIPIVQIFMVQVQDSLFAWLNA
jgi:hypothetical protein